MAEQQARLIAVEGVDGRAVVALARATRATTKRGRARVRSSGISWWDASGLFEQLTVADEDAGQPGARTLLLLYAADLVFRLRWDVRPALAEGKTVVAAPYVDTAVAFGRAAGIPGGWLTSLFRFAPKPDVTHHAARSAKHSAEPAGFVEFASALLSAHGSSFTHSQLLDRARAHLRSAEARGARATRGRTRRRVGVRRQPPS